MFQLAGMRLQRRYKAPLLHRPSCHFQAAFSTRKQRIKPYEHVLYLDSVHWQLTIGTKKYLYIIKNIIIPVSRKPKNYQFLFLAEYSFYLLRDMLHSSSAN